MVLNGVARDEGQTTPPRLPPRLLPRLLARLLPRLLPRLLIDSVSPIIRSFMVPSFIKQDWFNDRFTDQLIWLIY